MAKVEDVDWAEYFQSIKIQCPWSYSAWQQGQIEIIEYQGQIFPLGNLQARVYVMSAEQATLDSLAEAFDNDTDEWLWSYPGYGPYATRVPVLIQQSRQRLSELREKLDASS